MDSDILAEVMTRVQYSTEVVDGACWIWTGQINNWGYGVISVKGVKTAVHRVVYEDSKGMIPEGLHIDHICRNQVCVNPDHLQAITRSENIALGRLRKTHCPSGHPYSGENLVYAGKWRRCLTCKRAQARGEFKDPSNSLRIVIGDFHGR